MSEPLATREDMRIQQTLTGSVPECPHHTAFLAVSTTFHLQACGCRARVHTLLYIIIEVQTCREPPKSHKYMRMP
jgi:hypothetical protein